QVVHLSFQFTDQSSTEEMRVFASEIRFVAFLRSCLRAISTLTSLILFSTAACEIWITRRILFMSQPAGVGSDILSPPWVALGVVHLSICACGGWRSQLFVFTHPRLSVDEC
ncbi:hypothetical protein NDU88_002302, partial [Pleurodeles waltl]